MKDKVMEFLVNVLAFVVSGLIFGIIVALMSR